MAEESEDTSALECAHDLADAGRHREAIPLFVEAIDLGHLDAYLALGNSYSALRDYFTAAAYFRAGYEAGDEDAGLNLGVALENLGKVEEATEVYSKLWSASYMKAGNAYAWLLRDHGSQAEGEAILARASQEPDVVGALAAGTLAQWRWERGDRDSEALLRRGADEYPPARARLAELLRERGDVAEARRHLLNGVRRGELDSMVPLGNLLSEQGELAGAAEVYKRAVQLGDGFAAYNYGLMLTEQGEADETQAWFEKAAALGDQWAVERLRSDGSD